MDTIELKKYIYENRKIEYILENLECHNIKFNSNKNYYSASHKDGDNPLGIVIYNNEYLNYHSYSRNNLFNKQSDIITLVEYNRGINFINAIKYLHKILGLDYKVGYNKTHSYDNKKVDPLEIFKKVKSNSRVNVSDISILDTNTLDNFLPLLYIGWLREGIMPCTAKKFGIAYSYKYKRIVIPIKHWLTGELVGVNMRTTVENYEELGIKKYFLTPSYQKSLNLYGLYENYKAIQKAGYVVVVESEKSVLIRDSLGDSTLVALQGHSISDEQVRILIGLNVDIIISMDNDIPEEEILHMCNKFYGIRNVYYTKDKWDLLEKKDSVVDKGNKIFNFFIKYKTKYDINERNKYLNSLKRK